jgi:hypothetical protein
LIDIARFYVLKKKYPNLLLSSVWASLTGEYPEIFKCAVEKW